MQSRVLAIEIKFNELISKLMFAIGPVGVHSFSVLPIVSENTLKL